MVNLMRVINSRALRLSFAGAPLRARLSITLLQGLKPFTQKTLHSQGNKRKVPTKAIAELEAQLIQSALFKNPDLQNLHNTKNLPTWTVNGVIRSTQGKPRKNAAQFRKMMGL